MIFNEENAISFPNYTTFIYFLIKENIVMYVGQTANGLVRIQQHKLKKDFDTFKIIPCEKNQLLELEEKYIIKYQPKLNKNTIWLNYVDVARIRTKLRKNYNINTKDILNFINKNNIKIVKYKRQNLILKNDAMKIEDYFERMSE